MAPWFEPYLPLFPLIAMPLVYLWWILSVKYGHYEGQYDGGFDAPFDERSERPSDERFVMFGLPIGFMLFMLTITFRQAWGL